MGAEGARLEHTGQASPKEGNQVGLQTVVTAKPKVMQTWL